MGPRNTKQLLGIGLLSWFALLGVDFLSYAGVFAGLFQDANTFFLSPEKLFARIPVGYLSFAVLVGFLLWLMLRLDTRGWRDGAKLGGWVGALVFGSQLMGLWSIAPAPARLLFVWWVVQTVELAVAGAVAGAAFGGFPLRRLTVMVGGGVVVLFIVTVFMQSTGLAPYTPR